jgi:hypothetical protein
MCPRFSARGAPFCASIIYFFSKLLMHAVSYSAASKLSRLNASFCRQRQRHHLYRQNLKHGELPRRVFGRFPFLEKAMRRHGL